MSRNPTLEQLLAAEHELRVVLLREARIDDEYVAYCREIEEERYVGDLGSFWPPFAALAELRVVERRIKQLEEYING